jgi:hypothetical protein
LGSELGLLIRDAIGALLLIAAFTKGVDRHNSTAALAMAFGLRRARQILPLLLALESGVGVALLLGLRPVIFLTVASAMFVCFAAYLARARGLNLGCGCFGLGIPSRATRFTVARNLVIACAAAVVAALGPAPGASGGVANGSLWIVSVASLAAISLTAATALDAVREGRRLASSGQPSSKRVVV